MVYSSGMQCSDLQTGVQTPILDIDRDEHRSQELRRTLHTRRIDHTSGDYNLAELRIKPRDRK